jgi:hypothetical protein
LIPFDAPQIVEIYRGYLKRWIYRLMFIVYFDNSFMSEPKPESQESQDYPRLHSVIQQTYRLYVLDFLADN